MVKYIGQYTQKWIKVNGNYSWRFVWPSKKEIIFEEVKKIFLFFGRKISLTDAALYAYEKSRIADSYCPYMGYPPYVTPQLVYHFDLLVSHGAGGLSAADFLFWKSRWLPKEMKYKDIKGLDVYTDTKVYQSVSKIYITKRDFRNHIRYISQ